MLITMDIEAPPQTLNIHMLFYRPESIDKNVYTLGWNPSIKPPPGIDEKLIQGEVFCSFGEAQEKARYLRLKYPTIFLWLDIRQYREIKRTDMIGRLVDVDGNPFIPHIPKELMEIVETRCKSFVREKYDYYLLIAKAVNGLMSYLEYMATHIDAFKTAIRMGAVTFGETRSLKDWRDLAIKEQLFAYIVMERIVHDCKLYYHPKKAK